MKPLPASLAILALLCAAAPAFTQPEFNVVSLDGSAKVQHVSKKKWEKLTVDSRLRDNDMVETYFQTRLVVQFGSGNAVVLGPNSKVLFNVRDRKSDNGAVLSEVNLTLFGGGCFVKAVSNCRVSVFTSDAVGETQGGSFSAVVDPKTGETGFKSLAGSMKTRNISQKEETTLASGQTTSIFPGREPLAPYAVTVREIVELKQIFGDDRIDRELGAAGVRPAEEEAGVGPATAGAPQQYGGAGGMGYKREFSENRLWASIMTDRDKEELSFAPFLPPDVSTERKIVVQETNDLAMAGGRLFQSYSFIPSYSSGMFGAGLRLPIAANYTGRPFFYDTKSLSGYLDLVDHITIGPFSDSNFVKFGPVRNYTLGDGLLVDGYNNCNPYSIFHPLGLIAQGQLGDFGLKAFLGDVAAPSPGGAYLSFEPEMFHLGAGFFFDRNMEYVESADSTGFRFVNLPRAGSATVRLDPSAAAYMYQVDFNAAAISTYDQVLAFGMAFAQKLVPNRTDGFLLRVPTVEARMNSMCFKLNLTIQQGRIVEGQFNSSYMANREMLFDTAAAQDTLVTQNSVLNTRRLGTKLELFYGMNPLRGLSFSLMYKQNIFENCALLLDTNYADPDLSFGLSVSVNDSLWRPIRYGAAYVEETHGGLYPRGAVIPSWGLHAGLDIVTNPIIFGVGLCGGMSWYLLDMNSNNRIDPGDNVVEFYLGLRYGFL